MRYFIPQSDVQEITTNLGELNQRFAGKTILIAGCFGFLGKIFLSYFLHLNKYVLSQPCRVIGLDNFIIGCTPEEINDSQFTFVKHDICQPLWRVIGPKEPLDYILNLCSIADPKIYCKLPIETMRIGFDGNINLLELAHQKQSEGILLMSSSECYGNPPPDQIPTKETYNGNVSNIGERSCYDNIKRVGETLADIFFRLYKVNVKTIRPFNVISAGMSLNDGRVVPSFFKSLLGGNKIKIFSPGSETRTFAYGTDFITGAILILLNGGSGETYNLGNSEPEISMKDLGLLIQEVVGVSDMIEIVDPPMVYKKQPERRCPDLTKIKSELGYSPKVSLKDGLGRFYNWAKDNY